jgi:hypothetical protein
MISIPSQSKKHALGNTDLFGTVHYTKNCNFDEEGYIKLAQRTVQLLNEEADGNLELPLAFGRKDAASTIGFHLVTNEDPFTVSISETAITVTENSDANNPNYTLDSHARWFHKNWVSTDDNGWFHLDTSGTWDAGDTASLTTGFAHPVEVFRNKNRICFGNGNTVVMYSESGGSYTLDKTLTLPSDFEVIGLAYSNYKLGILTQLSDAISGQNQDAFFFTWNGADSEAGQGVEIGSDRGLGIVAYKGSWAVLTRAGQLRYFTGGGWQELAQLPFYFSDQVFGTSYNRDLYGDVMLVDGDCIYINYNGLLQSYGKNYQKYSPENPGGVLVFDPKVGLYHKFSHSISPVSMLTVTSANVNTTTNVLTKTAGTVPSTGSPVKYTSDKTNHIGGLKTRTVYHCIKVSSTEFKLATSKANADAGVAIDLTSTGAANNYFLALEVYDYGASLANDVGGLALTGADNGICNSLILGAQLADFDSTTQYDTLELVASDFPNRGYFVTPKIPSADITDTAQKVYAKYRTLKEGDSIILKIKDEDILGLPVSTPQGRTSTVNQCSWTGADAFTTTADLSDAKTAFDAGVELECEVIGGAGAGVLVKIADIAESSGTYSVELEEDVDGAASGRYCDVVIDNWTYLGSITPEDTSGYKEFAVGKNAPWFKYKVELRGVETTVEEVQHVNSVAKPSA